MKEKINTFDNKALKEIDLDKSIFSNMKSFGNLFSSIFILVSSELIKLSQP